MKAPLHNMYNARYTESIILICLMAFFIKTAANIVLISFIKVIVDTIKWRFWGIVLFAGLLTLHTIYNNVIIMREKYSEQRIVSCYEADANHNFRPTAMLDLMQEAAGRDASVLGFGYDDMISSNTAWVLSRIRVIFHKNPKWRDTINLKTWHKGANRIFYLRDFTLESPDSERLVSATTSWLIIDLSSRRMVRNTTLAENFDNASMGHAIEEPADKVILPKDSQLELVHTHKVVWSDIDTNGHVNNVKYAVWALDCVDYEIAKERELKEMLINYDCEVMPGQEVDLYRVSSEENGSLAYYVVGKVAGKTSFSLKMTF